MPQTSALNRHTRRSLALRRRQAGLPPQDRRSDVIQREYFNLAAHVGTILGRIRVGELGLERLHTRLVKLNRKLRRTFPWTGNTPRTREKHQLTAAAIADLSYSIRRDQTELKTFYADMLRLNEEGGRAVESERKEAEEKAAKPPPESKPLEGKVNTL